MNSPIQPAVQPIFSPFLFCKLYLSLVDVTKPLDIDSLIMFRVLFLFGIHSPIPSRPTVTSSAARGHRQGAINNGRRYNSQTPLKAARVARRLERVVGRLSSRIPTSLLPRNYRKLFPSAQFLSFCPQYPMPLSIKSSNVPAITRFKGYLPVA